MFSEENSVIPNKSVFKVQEVCSLVGIKSYVLRFWETEFEQISPIVSSSGLKLYERKDLEVLNLVKKILFEDKFSIEKAKAEVDRIYNQLHTPEEFVAGIEPAAVLSCSSMHLDDVEFENLDLAQNTLNDILNRVDILKEKYHWS